MRLWVAVLALIAGLGATIAADSIPATGGNIELTAIGHAHVQIEHAGKVIQIDPTPMGDLSKAKPADLILITDIHGDHLSAPSVEKLKKAGTVVVGPKSVADMLPGTMVIANGETRTFAGVMVEAVPMYNLTRGPSEGQLFHTKGRGDGFILTLGGKRIYFSGDTECIPEIKALKNIDVAFMTMNLPFTMPPSEAADCVKAFKPKIVYPYHYRQQGIDAEKNAQDFAAAMKGTAGVEVRMMSFYAAQPAGAAPAGGGGGGRQGGGRAN